MIPYLNFSYSEIMELAKLYNFKLGNKRIIMIISTKWSLTFLVVSELFFNRESLVNWLSIVGSLMIFVLMTAYCTLKKIEAKSNTNSGLLYKYIFYSHLFVLLIMYLITLMKWLI